MGSAETIRKYRDQVHSAVSAEAEKIVRFVADIVSIPSVTGDEEKCGLALARQQKKAGLDVAVVEAAPGRPNVVGTLSSGRPGPRLLLNGHIDVVPPGRREEWDFDPFAGDVKDGVLRGRGTVDMKSGLATGIYAAEMVRRLGIPWHGTIVTSAVSDEEVGGRLGTRHLLQRGLLDADFGINCEATNLGRIDIAHKGIMQVKVTFHGKAIHGSRPWLGVSAIDKAVDALSALRAHQKELATRRHPLCEGPASLDVGTINGGTVINMVASHCEVGLDRRVLPGESHASAKAEIVAILEECKKKDPEFSYTIEDGVQMPYLEIPADSPPVQALVAAATAVNGKPPVIAGKDAGTDAAWIAAYTKMPIPVFGPGDYLRGSLAPNETIAVSDILRATEIYILAILYLLAD